MATRWTLRPVADAAAVGALSERLNDLPDALARTLVLRGIDTFDTAKRFFRPSLSALHDPFRMRGMDAAAARVAQAIETGETVVVYGDYDVDGTTATALMTHFLRTSGLADVSYFVPNRFEHGYGLSPAGLDEAKRRGATLVVALDCGVTAVEEAKYARELGLDLVICDHHKPGDELPEVAALLDPKQPLCDYPFKELSGCGIGFKLIQAVLAHQKRSPAEALPYLDLVAVSTAADIVDLDGENRDLMFAGLERLRSNPRPGFRHLADAARTELSTATVENVVFTLGPRINAAGRLGSANKAVDLLLTEDEHQAFNLALDLEAINGERRELDQQIQVQAIKQAKEQTGTWAQHSAVLYDSDWHLGVIGIVASRIVEQFNRPAIMMCDSGPLVKGSARSIAGISIYAALQKCEDLLEAFGGHDFAAGLTIRPENVPAFQRRFDAAVGEVVTPGLLTPERTYDADVCLSELDERFWAVLKQFAPHGPQNQTPVFRARDLGVKGTPYAVGKDGAHLKLAVQQVTGAGEPFDVIAFRMGDKLPLVQQSVRSGQPLELLFSLGENHYKGRRSLQLKARDLRLADTPVD
jgi:single-stranded-DNA-specific exonuclease